MNTRTPVDGATSIAARSHAEKEDERAEGLERDLAATDSLFKGTAEGDSAPNKALYPSKEEMTLLNELLSKGNNMEQKEPQNEDADDDDKKLERTALTEMAPAIDVEGTKAKSESQSGDDDIPMSFPQKLMGILSNPEYSDIISWLPHGRGFLIYQKKRFESEIMPKHFKKSKFTSFTRKLNRWNFTRITRGPETGAYYHDYFQRDNHRLCIQMSSGKKNQDTHDFPASGMPSNTGAGSVGNAMHMLRLGTAGAFLQGQLGGQGIAQLEQRDRLLQSHSLNGQQQPGGTGLDSTLEISMSALQQSTASAYLGMLMAQEKIQAQLAALSASGAVDPLEFQRQQARFLLAQQQQLDLFNQQRLFQSQASLQLQQLSSSADSKESIINRSGNGGVKRASAA